MVKRTQTAASKPGAKRAQRSRSKPGYRHRGTDKGRHDPVVTEIVRNGVIAVTE